MISKEKLVCFYPGALNLGGVGKQRINLAKEMLNHNFRVHFFLTKSEGDYLAMIPKGVVVYKGKGGALKSIFSFWNYIKNEKPDIIISSRDYLNILNILVTKFANRKTKVIASVHVDYTAMPKQKGIRNYFLNKLGKILYKKADKVVAVSKGVAVDFSKRFNYPLTKVNVIYNPSFIPEKYTQNESKANMPFFETGLPVIIAVGRLTEQKNFSLLIDAFSLVRKKIDCKLLILGEGEQRKLLENKIEKYSLKSDVSLVGYVDNPIDYIKRAQVFVLSSSWEGFGNVIVEALGAGISIVSTDCPSGPAEILDNGKYGKLVPINDKLALADAMIEALNEKVNPEELIERAKAFSVYSITKEYMKIL